MIQTHTVPPETQQLIVAKVATINYFPIGLIEGTIEGMPIAA